MRHLVVLCLATLPVLIGAATLTCNYEGRSLAPGESYVFEKNCGRHNCTCDPAKKSEEMCSSVMIGCLHGDNCYKAGDAAVITGSSGSKVHCTCEKGGAGGASFVFAGCRSQTCTDSRTGEQKAKGEQVTTTNGGVTYVCTCDGVNGFKDCRDEASLNNEGKCLDHESGAYVSTGAAVSYRSGDTVLQCTCAGTNSYSNCRSNTCTDAVDSSVKKVGEKVTTRQGDTLYVCDCAGVEGYKNCQKKDDYDNRNKCKDINGNYAAKGERYRVVYGGVTYECTCDGANSGKDCSTV